VTTELLERIARLYSVEEKVRGQPPDTRRATRQARSKPQLDELKARMEEIRAKLSAKSALAVAIAYALKRWPALIRYCENGRLEIDNLIAEPRFEASPSVVATGSSLAQRRVANEQRQSTPSSKLAN
jgi:transposase